MNIEEVIKEISSVVKGKEEVIEFVIACFLSEGHILIEDVPGVGKTVLALSIARVMDLSFSRIQFTSDLLPSDITGVSVFDQKSKEFVFKKGPVFSNVILADEINRAPPKTQSALLEAMAERSVTVEGITYPLPRPFFVIATQNPVEHHGTYNLPESQLDRFMMKISIGYPDPETEREIITGEDPAEKVRYLSKKVTQEHILKLAEIISGIYISPEIIDFIMAIVSETRTSNDIILGVSTRGAIHLVKCCKAYAFVKGRDFVVPEDVIQIAPVVLSHRIITRGNITPINIVRKIIENLNVPQ